MNREYDQETGEVREPRALARREGRLAELAEKHRGEESRRFYPSFKGRLGSGPK